jgi:gliding motility-associated-like protein
MKNILLIVFLFCGYFSYGQIGIVTTDTVCANTPVTLSSDDSSYSYAWDTVAVNIGQPLQGGIPQLNIGFTFTGSVCYTVKYDPVSGNWYGFTVDGNAFDIVDYGTSPLNVPTAANISTLGNLGGYITNGNAKYVDVVRDSTGLWYAFISNGTHLVRVDFGNTLSTVPSPSTDVHTVTLSGVTQGMQISLMRYNGNWIGFLGDNGGGALPVYNIWQLNFGNNITNLTPTVTALPTGGTPAAFTNPSYFALYNDKVAGTWSMLVNNLGSGNNGNGLSRYDFGASLTNTSPTTTYVGTLGGAYTFCRGITIIEDCDSFYALALYGGAVGEYFAHLSFNNGITTDITNAPTIVNSANDLAGTGAFTKNSLTTFWHNDSLYAVTPCSANSTIYLLQDYWMSTASQVTYTPNVTYTFPPGPHNITLITDQGNQAHRNHYCKTIYALAPGAPILGNDTTACIGDTIILSPSIAGTGSATYQWQLNTTDIQGATSSTLSVYSNGEYSVTVNGAGLCTTGTSNVQFVQFVNRPVVYIGPDTTICSGEPLGLQSDSTYPAQYLYLWNTTPVQTTSSISVNATGSYTLTVYDGGCSASDTINVTANPSPVVNLGNDTTFCAGYVDNITVSEPAGSTFLWSDSTTDSTFAITTAGTYWVAVTSAGCIGYDTVTVNVTPAPVFNLGNDTTICNNMPITLGATNPNATGYIWSVDSTIVVYQGSYSQTDSMRALTDSDAYMTTNTGGIFSLTIVTAGGCSYTDTISIISQPGPNIMFNIPRFDTLCKTKPFVIDPGFYTGINYLWNTGATSESLEVNEGGTYWVTVSTANGCSATDTVSIKMNEVPNSGTLGDDTTLCNDQEIMLPPFTDTSLHIQWYIGGHDAAHYYGNPTNIRVQNAPGLYIAVITNECGTTVDSINITNKFCNLWFPNVFTPNNDGVNDFIQPLGDLSNITNYTLTIFDRWGQLLFTSTNPYDGWNGKYNNEPQPQGVYIYMMKFNVKNVPYTQHGNFTLLK